MEMGSYSKFSSAHIKPLTFLVHPPFEKKKSSAVVTTTTFHTTTTPPYGPQNETQRRVVLALVGCEILVTHFYTVVP